MCNPTTGSPTITLFQLRSNYHTILNSRKVINFNRIIKFIKIVIEITILR